MSWDRPDPPAPPGTWRPFDELIAELAERTGRPCWPVERCLPSEVARRASRSAA